MSERRACSVLSQPCSAQRRKRHVPSDEPRLLQRIVELASAYGRYDNCRVTALLRRDGVGLQGSGARSGAGLALVTCYPKREMSIRALTASDTVNTNRHDRTNARTSRKIITACSSEIARRTMKFGSEVAKSTLAFFEGFRRRRRSSFLDRSRRGMRELRPPYRDGLACDE